VNRHVLIVNAACLTKRPVLEPDINIEDGVTVLKDAKEVGESSIVREERRVLAAELGSRADQRLDGGELAFDVSIGVMAKALDHIRRVGASDAIARNIVDLHDPEQNRDRHRYEDHQHRRFKGNRETPRPPTGVARRQVARCFG
jgi:hypothetical protein